MKEENKKAMGVVIVGTIIILTLLGGIIHMDNNSETKIHTEYVPYEVQIPYEVEKIVEKEKVVTKIVEKIIEVEPTPYEPDLKCAYINIGVSLPYINVTGNVTGFHWEVYLDGEFFYESKLVGPNITMVQAWWYDNNLTSHNFKIVVHAILDPSSGARTTTYILENEGEFIPNEMVIVDNKITNPTEIRWVVVV